MNLIKRKLRSQSGASMLIAMVFMMFCVFIGGSVLVSATANAYRVAHLNEQQDFLNQRSAALLLSDQLQLEKRQFLTLKVTDSDQTFKEVVVFENAGHEETGATRKERVINFTLLTNDTKITPLQRLMLETTVWRYLKENDGMGATVIISGFTFGKNGAEIGTGDFWYTYAEGDPAIEGSISITASVSGTEPIPVSIPAYTAYFSSGLEDELYDFHVSFGENSQLRLTMDAYKGKSYDYDDTAPVADDPKSSTGLSKVVSESYITTISWRDPLVEKGGAEA